MIGWRGRACSPLLLPLLLAAALLDALNALRATAQLSRACEAGSPMPRRAAFTLSMAARANSPARFPLNHFNKSFLTFEGGDQIMIEYDQTSKDRVWYMPSELISSNATEVLHFWKEKRRAEVLLQESIEKGEVDRSKYFADYRRYLSVEKAEVLQLNHDFFLAWQNGYSHIMRNLWSHLPSALCAVAGSRNVLTGYDNITRYWTVATRPSDQPILTKVMLHFLGDVAVVTSTLELHSKRPGQPPQTFHCTNIFLRDREQGRYLLWAHLATNQDSPKDGYKDPTRRPTRRKDRRLEGLRERILGLADQRLSQDEAGLDAREAQSLPGLPPFLLSLLSGLAASGSGRGFPPPGLPIVVMHPKPSPTSLPSLPSPGGKTESSSGRRDHGGKKETAGPLSSRPSREDSDDNDEGEEEDEEEEGEERDEELATATVNALQYLHLHHRLAKTEKQVLLADLIQRVNTGSLSKVEIAWSVLIAGIRPGEAPLSEGLPREMAHVDVEDMKDFEHVCHRIARELLEIK